MRIVIATETGNYREVNEDFAFAHPQGRYVIVADGMGGAAAGEIASKMAAISASRHLDALEGGAYSPADLENAVQYANSQIWKEACANENLAGMGSTLTLAALYAGHADVAHVGDSCAYLYADGRFRKLTKDHSYVQQLIDEGRLSPEEAERYPYRNIITRVVGMESLTVDLYHTHWKQGDVLLLCSDGLLGGMSEEEIARILACGGDLDAQAQALVSAAVDGGSKDNVTVALAVNTGEDGHA